MNNVTNTLSGEAMTKIKVIDLDELYNFYIHEFFIRNRMLFQYVVSSLHIFGFQNFKFSNNLECSCGSY